LRNGDLTEVAGFEADGSITLIDGRSLPAWFREFSHGYATPRTPARARPLPAAFLLMADEGIGAGNLKQAYVSNSRFEESQMIYTTDKVAAREAMMRPADRKLALELVGPGEQDARPTSVAIRPRLRPGNLAAAALPAA